VGLGVHTVLAKGKPLKICDYWPREAEGSVFLLIMRVVEPKCSGNAIKAINGKQFPPASQEEVGVRFAATVLSRLKKCVN
jgi:hypothetical protein